MALNINGTTGISGVDGSASAASIAGTDANTGLSFASDTVNINTGGSTRATVDSSGRLLLGTTTAGAAQCDTFTLETSGHTGMTFFSGSSSRGTIAFGDGRTGNEQYRGAFIYDHSDDSLRSVTADTERFRVTGAGTFCVGVDGGTNIGTSGSTDTHDGFMAGPAGTTQMCRTSGTTLYINRNGSGGNIVDFRYGGSSVGNISNSGNSLPSDRNYKKNITNLTLGLDLVNKLQPVSYQYKFSNDSDPLMYGLVAQDFETALNDVGVAQNTAAILQYEDKKDEKQSDYNLDYTKLTPILINAVKELSAKITTLETKVAALEAG